MPKTILIVEDDAIVALDTSQVLQEEGYSVITATTGEKALHLIATESQPDLVLMDMDLGQENTDGTDTADEISKKYDIPVVFHSGHTDKETIEKSEKTTKYGYIQKTPGNREFLLATIKMALKLHESEQNLKKSEQRYKELFNNINHHVYVFTVTGDGRDFIIKENNRKLQGSAKNPSEYIGKSIFEVRPKLEEYGIIDAYRRVWYSGKPEKIKKYYYKDGDQEGFFCNYIYKLPSGEIVDVLEDLTEEEELKENLNIYKQAINSTRDRFGVVDRNYRFTTINDAFCEFHNKSSEEIIGSTVEDLLGKDVFLFLKDKIDRCFNGEHLTFEMNGTAPDSSMTYNIVKYVPLRGNGHNPEEITAVVATITAITEMRHKELELAESRRKYSLLAENAGDVIACFDTIGTILYISEAVYRIGGFKPEDLIGTNGFDRVHPDDRARVMNLISDLIENGGERRSEHRLAFKSGVYRWVEVSARLMNDETTGEKQVVAVIRDINDRKKMEQTLIEIESYYENITEYIPVFNLNQHNELMRVNSMAATLLDKTIEELIGQNITSLIPKIEQTEFYQAYKRVMKSNTTETVTVSIQRSDSRQGWYKIHILPIYNGVQCIAHDISDQKAAEEALRENEIKFRTFVENVGDILYTLNPDGIFTYVSPSWTTILGHDVSEVIGRSFVPHVHPDDVLICSEFLKKVLSTGESQSNVEYRVRHRDGDWRWHVSNGSPIKNAYGEAVSYLGVARDITERKLREEKLEELIVEKDFLVREVHHRVKNNLAIINSLINLKALQLNETDKFSDLNHQIDAIRLVHEILTHSEQVSKVDINKYIHTLITTIFSSFSKKRIDLQIDVDEIYLDSKTAISLGLLINEIATNSIKHGFSNSGKNHFSLKLKSDPKSDSYNLIISNSGPPIPETINLQNPNTFGMRLIATLAAQINGTVELTKMPDPKYVIEFLKKNDGS